MGNVCFCSLILLGSMLNGPEFSQSLLFLHASYFEFAINSVTIFCDFKFDFWRILILMVFDEWFLCQCIWSSKQFSYLGKALFTLIPRFNRSVIRDLILYSSRWRYSTRFWFLLSELLQV